MFDLTVKNATIAIEQRTVELELYDKLKHDVLRVNLNNVLRRYFKLNKRNLPI